LVVPIIDQAVNSVRFVSTAALAASKLLMADLNLARVISPNAKSGFAVQALIIGKRQAEGVYSAGQAAC
jgi:hypothetical protein